MFVIHATITTAATVTMSSDHQDPVRSPNLHPQALGQPEVNELEGELALGEGEWPPAVLSPGPRVAPSQTRVPR